MRFVRGLGLRLAARAISPHHSRSRDRRPGSARQRATRRVLIDLGTAPDLPAVNVLGVANRELAGVAGLVGEHDRRDYVRYRHLRQHCHLSSWA